MDRSKPLWEIWVIEGLEDGQVALLQKTHHAAIDGMSSIKAMELLFDFEPQPRTVDAAPADFWEQTKPTNGRLLQAAYENLNRYWWEGVQRIPELARAGARLSRQMRGNRRQELMPLNAPKTRLNASVDAKRAFRNVGMSLPTLKMIAKSSGVKINDVMLAICGEGVARYLARHGEALDKSLIASCPVSLHKPGDGKIGNQVSSINISMKNEVSDLVERLQAIHQSANVAKETLANLGDAMPTDFGGFGMPAAFQAMARSMENGVFADLATQPPMNLVLSNVPGFRVPMYVAGARLVRQMPMSIVVHGGAVNLTVTSYLDRMDLGITVASKRVPDIDALREDLQAAYDQLVDTVLGAQEKESDEIDYEELAVAAA
jgi:WS/DGAT/MGAT family acyltransferase